MPAKEPHPDTAEMVERLGRFAPVSGRAMFGGHGLFVDGSMFGLVDDGALFLKVDDENRATFEAPGMEGAVDIRVQWQVDADGVLQRACGRPRRSPTRSTMLRER